MDRRPIALAVVLCAWLALAGSAQAATLKISSGVLTYAAGDGEGLDPEQSDLTVDLLARDPTQLVVADDASFAPTGLTIVNQSPGCRRPDPVLDPSLDPATTALCPLAFVSAVNISLGAGDDSAYLTDLPRRVVASGGDGDDTIAGGALADSIAGSAGDDDLDGGAGDDDLDGGPNDDLISGDEGRDTIAGGDENPVGEDSMSLGDVIDGGDDADVINAQAGEDSVFAGDGDDTITGGDHDDDLYGGDGVDTLRGQADNDLLDGGGGDDTLDGGGGADAAVYSANGANDAVSIDLPGRTGTSTLTGEQDNFVSIEGGYGGAGNDTLIGDGLANELNGGGGNDLLRGAGGADRLDGGTDSYDAVGGQHGDVVDYTSSSAAVGVDTTVTGGDGQACPGPSCEGDSVRGVEVIQGSAFGDRLTLGDDGRLEGRGGSDTLTAVRGRITLQGGPGADTMSGTDPEIDTYAIVSYAERTAAQPVRLVLGDGAPDGQGCPGASCEGDVIGANIDRIEAGGGDDVVLDDASTRYIVGGPGNDELRGGPGGYEFLVGGPGDDVLDGGPLWDALIGDSGHDTLLARDGEEDRAVSCGDDHDTWEADPVDPVDASCEPVGGGPSSGGTVRMVDGTLRFTGAGADANAITVAGSSGNIVLSEAGAALADGDGPGGCSVAGAVATCAGVTSLNADLGAGDDWLQVAASGLPATVDGGAGDDVLLGGDMADTLSGGPDRDRIDEGAGSGMVTGGSDDDTLVGGPGADTLHGDAGIDMADYSSRTGALNVSLDGKPNDGAKGEKDQVAVDVENVTGGDGPDKLKGSPSKSLIANVLFGGGGKDVIDGLDGDDTVDGGGGDGDVVKGGDGADTVSGGPGLNDKLSGGAGDDSLRSADGLRDVLSCGAGLLDGYTADSLDKIAKNCEVAQ